MLPQIPTQLGPVQVLTLVGSDYPLYHNSYVDRQETFQPPADTVEDIV